MRLSFNAIPTETSLELFASEFSRSFKKPSKTRPWYEEFIAPTLLVFIPMSSSSALYWLINYIIDPWMGLQSIFGSLASVFCIFFYINGLISLVRALLADPGVITEEWKLWDGSKANQPPLPSYAKFNHSWINAMSEKVKSSHEIQTIDHSNAKQSQAYFNKSSTQNMGITLMKTDELEKQFEEERYKDMNVITLNDAPSSESAADDDSDELPISEREFHEQMKGMEFPFGIVPNWDNVQFLSHVTKKKHKNSHKSDASSCTNNMVSQITNTNGNIFSSQTTYKQPVPKQWCKVCLLYKPPRSHHCSRCKRCVAKMDHHCIFLGKCVGKDNYKYFYLFLLHATFGLSYGVILMLICFIAGELSIFTFKGGFAIFLIGVGAYFIKFIGQMLIYHNALVVTNRTQIEQIFDQPVVQYRFSKRSLYLNAQVALGKYSCVWLLPI